MSNGKMFEESFARANISANKNAERSATMSIIIIRGAAKTHSHTDIHTHIDYAEKAINSVFFFVSVLLADAKLIHLLLSSLLLIFLFLFISLSMSCRLFASVWQIIIIIYIRYIHYISEQMNKQYNNNRNILCVCFSESPKVNDLECYANISIIEFLNCYYIFSRTHNSNTKQRYIYFLLSAEMATNIQ